MNPDTQPDDLGPFGLVGCTITEKQTRQPSRSTTTPCHSAQEGTLFSLQTTPMNNLVFVFVPAISLAISAMIRVKLQPNNDRRNSERRKQPASYTIVSHVQDSVSERFRVKSIRFVPAFSAGKRVGWGAFFRPKRPAQAFPPPRVSPRSSRSSSNPGTI
jgi:hypothetical protein